MPDEPSFSAIAARIAELPMDEPPADSTIARARALASELAGGDGSRVAQRAALMAQRAALIDAMRACLRAAADREVLFVFAVPPLVAAADLLDALLDAPATGPHDGTALAGARHELETLPPAPGSDTPDVPLSSLARKPPVGG